MPSVLQVIAFLSNFLLIKALSDIAYINDPRVQTMGTWATTLQCGNYTIGNDNGISLTFNGTEVAVVADLGPNVGFLNFAIDDKTPERLDRYADNTNIGPMCNRVIYQSPTLPYGVHKLTATVAGPSTGVAPAWMYFEYFSITIPDDAGVATGSVGITPLAPNEAQAKVTAPAAVGIAIGAAAVGSVVVTFGFLFFPFFLRKILSRDAVTGVVQSGLYRVINERYLNAAVPPNDNDKNPIAGISYGRLPEHRWDIIRQANGRYHIKNHGYTTLYVGWESIPAKAGDHVVNHREQDRDWHITETAKDSRKYRISTKSNDEELFWTLPYEDRGTPIELTKSSKDTSQLWSLCLLEAHHDSPA